MLIVLSPAKTLDYEVVVPKELATQPEFLEDSEILVKKLSKMSRTKLGELLHVSPQLADLNYGRYKEWTQPFTTDNAKTAIHVFKGGVYQGLVVEHFKKNDLKFAQKQLRILSGLYGLLRPLDLMQAYRLEMGTKWAIDAKTKNLYAFWDDKITVSLNESLKATKSKQLVNLASNEYFKSVNTKLLEAEVVTPVFKDWKKDQFKVISFFAKKARGQMAAYIIQNRIKKVEDLKGFDVDGYGFNAQLSEGNELVFTRMSD